jgi:hypothetical protein
MEMKSAADYLAQYNITMDFNKTVVEPKYPFVSFKDKKDIKKIEKVINEIRPNYPEYDNVKLYKDKHCSTWVHVCEATLETGINPVKYVPQPLPLKDIQYMEDDETTYDFDDNETTSTIGSM